MDRRGFDGGGLNRSDEFANPQARHKPRSPELRRGGSGDSSSNVRLPPLPRPPSAEDIHAARQHLVLLKAKMPQRFRDRSAGPAPRSASPSRQSRGRSMPPRPGPEESPRSQRDRSQSRHSHHSNDGSMAMDKPRRKSREVQIHEQPTHHAAPQSEPFGQPAHHASPRRREQSENPANNADPRSEQFAQQGSPHASQPPQSAAPPTSIYEAAAMAEGEEPSQLIKCEDCGRSFNPDAIERHRKICKKIFCEKRKKFDSAANRLGDFENAQSLVQNAKKIEKEVEKKIEKAEVKKEEPQQPSKGQPNNGKPLPKWKQQSLAFRAAMLASKAAMGDDEAAKKMEEVKEEMGDPPPDPNKTVCPHCGRSFNKESAQRHIDICLKTFGSKPGGGRLVRGSGKGCNQTAAVQASAKAAANPKGAGRGQALDAAHPKGAGRGRPPPAGDPVSKRQPAGYDAAPRASSRGPKRDLR